MPFMPLVRKLHVSVEDIGHLYDEDALFVQKRAKAPEIVYRELEVFQNMEKGDQLECTGPAGKLGEGAIGYL